MFIIFEDYFISTGSFIDIQLFHKSQSSSFTWLPNKYHNKTNVLLNITSLMSFSNPNPLEIFTPNHTIEVLKLWLLAFIEEKN